MKSFLVFLFIFVFSPLAFSVGGNVGSPEIDKWKEQVALDQAPKTVRDVVEDTLSDWNQAECTYYDPMDSTQTKLDPDGKGASGRRITSGSISLGSSLTEDFVRSDSLCVFIQVKDCDVMTPYGKGIFRVDDMMAGRYNKGKKYHIDFFYKDLTSDLRRKGRFIVEFKLYKIAKTAESYS